MKYTLALLSAVSAQLAADTGCLPCTLWDGYWQPTDETCYNSEEESGAGAYQDPSNCGNVRLSAVPACSDYFDPRNIVRGEAFDGEVTLPPMSNCGF